MQYDIIMYALMTATERKTAMGSVTIRNLSDALIKKLKAQAKASNRSLEAELRELLSNEIHRREKMKRFRAEIDRIAAMTPKGVQQTDSTVLIREDRDR
jgi:antitoxin FitA